MTERAYVYLSSVSTGDAPEGWIARPLKYNATGQRYVEPVRAERVTASSSFARTPQPRPATTPRTWSDERIAALPLTSGKLTRTSFTRQWPHHGTVVHCRCDGGSPQCAGKVTIPASLWARDRARPRSCKACAKAGSRRAFALPHSDKGFAKAREMAAKEKGRAA